jgi:hypothetical protein
LLASDRRRRKRGRSLHKNGQEQGNLGQVGGLPVRHMPRIKLLLAFFGAHILWPSLKLLREQDLEPEEDSTYDSGDEISNGGWESDRSQNRTLSMMRPIPKGDGALLTVPSRVIRRVVQKPSEPQASKNSEASDSEESQAGGVDLVPSITFEDLGGQHSSYFTGPALEDPSLNNKAGQ